MPLQAFPGVAASGERETANRTATAAYGTVTIAAGGTIGVYTTSAVQFIASTAFDVCQLTIWNIAATSNSTARGDVVIDIMIGGAGAEQTIIQGLQFGGRTAYSSYTLPIYIPAGTRISGKVAAGVASRSLTWCLDVKYAMNRDRTSLPSKWVAYGTNISSGVGAYGTLITPGNLAWSAWTALTTSTTYAHNLWLPMFNVGTGTTITALSYRSQFAIASTTDAATMVTNSTGFFEGPELTGSTTEQLGQYPTATNPVTVHPGHIIYAPRASGASVSARTLCSGAPDTNAVSCAVLAAVK